MIFICDMIIMNSDVWIDRAGDQGEHRQSKIWDKGAKASGPAFTSSGILNRE